MVTIIFQLPSSLTNGFINADYNFNLTMETSKTEKNEVHLVLLETFLHLAKDDEVIFSLFIII